MLALKISVIKISYNLESKGKQVNKYVSLKAKNSTHIPQFCNHKEHFIYKIRGVLAHTNSFSYFESNPSFIKLGKKSFYKKLFTHQIWLRLKIQIKEKISLPTQTNF